MLRPVGVFVRYVVDVFLALVFVHAINQVMGEVDCVLLVIDHAFTPLYS